jgi:hypothetical protein
MTATHDARPNAGAPELTRAEKIAGMNDAFREGKAAGRFFVTPGVIRLTQGQPDELIALVRKFDAFDADNDPYGEHDFGHIDYKEAILWKIDYLDLDLKHASPDPTNAETTIRVLTLMCRNEY